jgi:translation initiation factor 1 (eIF-1/SUI1)
MHNMMEHLKDVKVEIENQGGKLVITLSGEPEKLQKLEKKLKALHELCGDGECGCACC